MSDELDARYKSFDELSSRSKCERPSRLITAYQPSEAAWNRFKLAATLYLCKCIPGNPLILDEAELLNTYYERQHEIKNITPNGMIVPKRHTILEYNAVVRAFAHIVDEIGINDLISSWHIPLNVRVKFSEINQENMTRHHPTEHVHSDSWAGESAESVTIMLPFFGDVERNHVCFYDPPDDFQESWLGPRPTYKDGEEIANRYKLNPFIPRKGQLVLTDFSSLHASTRKPGAGHRISIDTTFALKRNRGQGMQEVIHPWRENERLAPETLSKLGETHLFVFPDSVEQQVDSQGGFKHPTNLGVIPLLETTDPPSRACSGQ